MGKLNFLAINTDPAAVEMMVSDFHDLGNAAANLAMHGLTYSGGLTSVFKWLAFAAAVYLLILDRSNWRTNIFTALLVPYTFLSLPTFLFRLFRGEIGMWISLVAVVLRLFFEKKYPEWQSYLELPGALVILTVVSPSLVADTIRTNWIGVLLCLAVACYLLQEHIRAAGGFKNAFEKANGYTNTIGIVLLLVYPIWSLIALIL